jgi:manganese transport protein
MQFDTGTNSSVVASADIMGQFANSRLTHIAALVGTAVVLLLNICLIVQTVGIPIPGLPAG